MAKVVTLRRMHLKGFPDFSLNNQSNGFWGPFQGFSGDMWWCSANSATAIADFITMVPGNQQLVDTLQNSFYHVQYFNLNENNNQGGINYLKSNPTLAVSNGFTDNFYDDEGWWALAWIAAYDINRDGEFLNAATDIFQAMTGG
jgi:hypothetical protein